MKILSKPYQDPYIQQTYQDPYYRSYQDLYDHSRIECYSSHWECKNQWCIQNGYLCDGDDNCGDGSDETPEVCGKCTSTNEWSCANGQLCIPKQYLCNGKPDCSDASDEESTRCYRSTVVRLVNGINEDSGIVQIRKYGVWGSICDHEWDYKDATVVCRMLGYQGPAIAYQKSYFEEVDGIIWANDVNCTGTERNIDKCEMNLQLKSSYCDQSKLAGVLCMPKTDSEEKCGQRFVNRNKEEKVVGGYFALHGEFPWQVEIVKKEEHKHQCGGTIIDHYHIITAAHCFTPYDNSTVDPNEWLVIVGNLEKYFIDIEEQIFEVEAIFNNEEYKWPSDLNETFGYDISLFKLKPINGHGIIYGVYVQPACLIEKDTEVPIGLECYTSGWGDIFLGSSNGSDILKGTPVDIISDAYCSSPEIFGFKITSTMICAGYKEGHIGNCHGDSGGPLVCPLKGVYTLTGIVSFGEGCAWPHYPTVYGKVSQFLDWIEEKKTSLN